MATNNWAPKKEDSRVPVTIVCPGTCADAYKAHADHYDDSDILDQVDETKRLSTVQVRDVLQIQHVN